MGVNAQWDWNKIQAGFSRIRPGEYLRFDVDLSGKSTVYISAVAADGKLISDSLAREPDLSVIVGTNAQIYDTKYGTIWYDTHGHCHQYSQPHGKTYLDHLKVRGTGFL